ncbi:aminotransferase class I/II-fold pyridoxal phosphate-dependent enzyme [Flavobacterium rakeshii]|uniref:Aminotransferase class I/II-fold pyridoxal phosphate-dependent enzyme n=1 Tax=Flavobacterium rakeshii TaxID=1038845 RepID=A0A6N8HCJ8_9FLAO|nr:aminotransferase class I/II-fold pyridoxal phosphate-dependent enzyme [Flavobacterium rakeshii]MUV03620.1 aminotransferase class I/II-fold pyridoxal phosphate-dependent enzyme [Flavobacterium rakeshii]
MSLDKIWLSSPHMGGNEQKYVNEAFDTNWVAPLGPNVNGFEGDLETYLLSNSHVGVLSSGTSALHLGLILLGVGYGDEVICQSMTFSASANPIKYVGANPVFVDSEPDTWNICPDSLEEAIKDRIKRGKKPKAIIAVHLYGMPYKADRIKQISDLYDIPVLEDSAEALGSTFKGQKCGTFGDIGILSFNGNKIITTSGGGAIVLKNKELKDKAVFLSTQARDAAPHYQHSEVGYNYRMSNVCAGIGRGQMEVLDEHISLRRRMNHFYNTLFENIKGVNVFKEPNGDFYSNHWLSAITVDFTTTGKTREDLRLAFEEKNIESRPLWKPMHMQPVFKGCSYYGGNVSESLFESGLCLPSGSNLEDVDRERIFEVINTVFDLAIST